MLHPYQWLSKIPIVGRIGKRLKLPGKLPGSLITSLAVTGLLLGVRQLGGVQPLELVAFDQMWRLRPQQQPDPRLLLVEITEADIRYLKKWPPTDETLAQVLNILQRHQPKVIGLDLVRDIPSPPGYEQLVAQLGKANTIAIATIGNNKADRVLAPPSVPQERIGFNDIPLDPDSTVRRNLMFASDGTSTFTSFAVQLALFYLQDLGISPRRTTDNELQLGKVVFTKLEPHDGGYQNIDAGGYQILLSYRSPDRVARKISLTQVLNGEFDPLWVEEKIVLIGVTAPSLKDLFLTPYSVTASGHGKMPGVVLHGQMTSQILSAVLDGEPLFWFWSPGVEMLWIFLWALLGGAVAWRCRHPLTLGAGAIASLGVLGALCYAIFLEQGWVPVVAPSLAFMMTGSAIVLRQMQQAWRQQRMMMKLLGQQISPEIALALWQGRDRLLKEGRLPWQMVTATVLFTDLKGYSSVAEGRSPLEIIAWLNEYQSAMTEIVLGHQGIVKDFTGDGMRAVFGVPVPRTTAAEIAADAENSVNCALAMGERLAQLNQKWQGEGLPPVQMRVGIFTGPVAVGSLGSKHRLEYGVIGDSVNIAARLESYDKHRHEGICRVLIGKETLVHLGGKFEAESWGSLTLKGKQQPVEVFLISGKLSSLP
ncbi:MAG: CHASE2 domain-containing protein [Hormoscilla sp.]